MQTGPRTASTARCCSAFSSTGPTLRRRSAGLCAETVSVADRQLDPAAGPHRDGERRVREPYGLVDLLRLRIDPDHLAAAPARHPDVAGAGRDGGGLVVQSERLDLRADDRHAGDGAVTGVRDPGGA